MEETTTIPAGPVELEVDIAIPDDAGAVVLFAHGSGSSRRSERNRFVAERLQHAGFGTVLFDLLAPFEENYPNAKFDIPMLGGRLLEATNWLRERKEARGLPVGYFGASTGAAAALWAAAETDVQAVVSRGGRPDLAEERLADVTAPVLLIVGERDEAVLDLNREAKNQLGGSGHLSIVPGAGHLFEEADALGHVADLARDWFKRYLTPKAVKGGPRRD